MTFETDQNVLHFDRHSRLQAVGAWFLSIDAEDPFGGRFVALDEPTRMVAEPMTAANFDLDLPLAA